MADISSSTCGWWVTTAANNEEVTFALQLLASIRASSSTKEVAVIYDGTGLSSSSKSALAASFDYALEMKGTDFGGRNSRVDLESLENWTRTTGPPDAWEASLKLGLSAWKLCCCKKAVFLHPASLLLDNCDALFMVDGDFCVPPIKGRRFNTSVFVFKPNLDTFTDMMSSFLGGGLIMEECGREPKILSLDLALNVYFGGSWTALGPEHGIGNGLYVSVGGRTLGPTGGGCPLKIINTDDLSVREKIVTQHGLYLQLNRFGNSAHHGRSSEPIAIVGLACRFPGANNQDEFWELLREGRDETRLLPASRAFTRGREGFDSKPIQETPAGYLKSDIDCFDAKFFHISRREAEYMDPQQRLLLEVSWEALENAGINPQGMAGSNASVYVGMWTQEYAMVSEGELQQNSHFRYLGNAFCASSARISHFLGLRGPSITMEAGCAASLEAVHNACESLRSRCTDLVICGGVNLALQPSSVLGGLDTFVLSKDGKCKTFDKEANGFARGEAVVVLILKRLSTALRDNDELLGLLEGSAVTSDGAGSSMGTPNPDAQKEVIRAALSRAGVEPHEISYVEAHGTGTPVGDPIEFHALNTVFGHDPKRGGRPLVVGSVKTNIGHTEGASGLAGLVKVLLAMKARTIPRHLNLVDLNPAIDLGPIPAVIPVEKELEWNPVIREGGLVAGVSSFGLSGTNVHVIVREPPARDRAMGARVAADASRPAAVDRTCHILALSAASETALSQLVASYIALLEQNAEVGGVGVRDGVGWGGPFNLANLAYSANTGRAQLSHRLAVVAPNCSELYYQLQRGQTMTGRVGSEGSGGQKVVFLFTGQGSQYVEMGLELYSTHPYFKHCVDRCATLLSSRHSLDLHAILRDTALIHKHSQVVLFCLGFCLAELWAWFGVRPDVVLGHSVGEFGAAVVAGLISLEHGLALVVERARLVSSRCSPGAMLVVKAPASKTKNLMAEFLSAESGKPSGEFWLDVAALNSSEETVVSGPPHVVTLFEEFCAATKIQTVHLSASHAFHSRAMDPILEEYRAFAANSASQQQVKPNNGPTPSKRVKFISGALVKKVANLSDLDPDYWVAHLREPVQFMEAFRLLNKDNYGGCDIYIEIGPQPVLLSLAMSHLSPEVSSSRIFCPSLRRNEGSWVTLLTSLGRMFTGGVTIDWDGVDRGYERTRLPLPTYPWQRERYWIGAGRDSDGAAEGARDGEGSHGSSSVEALTVHSALLHPLLGRRLPCASSSLVVYHNSLRLNEPQGEASLHWLCDHKIAGTVILPAAAYVEIVLAAGADLIGNGGGGGGGGYGVGGGGGGSLIPLTLQNLVLDSPLVLSEERVVHIQTTVATITTKRPEKKSGVNEDAAAADEGPQLKYNVTVYKQSGFDGGSGSDGGTWTQLASATFVPCASAGPDLAETGTQTKIEMEALKQSMSPRPTASQDLYTALDKLGFHFGPQFKSIQAVWSSECATLVQTSCPYSRPSSAGSDGDSVSGAGARASSSSYFTHPIIVDAMVQSLTVFPINSNHNDSNSNSTYSTTVLQLPVTMDKYLCTVGGGGGTERSTWTDTMYILVKWRPGGGGGVPVSASAALYNEDGQLLGLMRGVDVVTTTIDSFLDSLRSHVPTYPSFYNEIWCSRLGPRWGRLDTWSALCKYRTCASKSLLGNAVLELTTQGGKSGEEGVRAGVGQQQLQINYPYAGNEKSLDELVYLYILKSLGQLGLIQVLNAAARNGQQISMTQLIITGQIADAHIKMFRRCFQILEEEGDVAIETGSSEVTIKVKRCLAETQEIKGRLQEFLIAHRGQAAAIECQYVVKFGEALTGLLQGRLNPLVLLFPDEQDRDRVGAAALYIKGNPSYMHNKVVLCLRALEAEIRRVRGKASGAPDLVLRCLEVGGGTGSMTQLLIKELDSLSAAHGTQYEYTFTDISPHFVKLASQRFGASNKNMVFKVLDIEADPKRQGLAPHSFDIVFGDSVLHATRDLSDSVTHTRSLLVPGGALLLVEIVARVRMLDISFGFLDGWWRFADHDLRPDYACISTDEWETLLASHGFSRVEPLQISASEDERLEVIAAFADNQQTSPQIPQPGKGVGCQYVWLIFGGRDELLASDLKSRLQQVGEKVILIPHAHSRPGELSQQQQKNGSEIDGVCEINMRDEKGFVGLLDSFVGRGWSLAGVIYIPPAPVSPEQDAWNQAKDHDSLLTHLIEPFTNMARGLSTCSRAGAQFTVYLVTAGMQSVSDSDPIRTDPLHSILIGINSSLNNETSAGLDYVNIDVQPYDDADAGEATQVGGDVFAELWTIPNGRGGGAPSNELGGLTKDLPELYIAFRNGVKWVRRVVEAGGVGGDEYVRSLQFPNTEQYKLAKPESGSLSELKILPATQLELLDGQIEVAVSAASLNFRDLLLALSSADSSELFGVGKTEARAQHLGLDFSGVVSRVAAGPSSVVVRFGVGDRVFGFTSSELGGSLASHVVVPSENVTLMRPGSTFETAASLPTILLTVYYFLIKAARLRASERILIHTASGGVGLLAIQVAQLVGAEVYATAGSVRKQTYLQKFMGVKHVYSSRSTEFGSRVLEDTQGAGVDIVLNSLTGSGFKETSLGLCATGKGARFLEMSKLNIWSEEEVRALRPDVKYVVQDVSRLVSSTAGATHDDGDGDELTRIGSPQLVFKFRERLLAMKGVKEETSVLSELPVTRFTLSRVHDAFRYLQAAKQIGKVVIKMPRSRLEEGGRLVHSEELFNEFGSYLITGGLGGIGLEVAKWMAKSGAKYLVLMGRSDPSPGAESVIDHLRRSGDGRGAVNVLVVQGDVGDMAQCTRMLETVWGAGFPPLRGIMHGAGVIAGAGKDRHNPDVSPALGQQTVGTYLTACRPKVHGTWNLHLLSLHHQLPLDHFVLFSSAITTLGGFGQGNYVAANRYLDAFVEYRRSLGLPCTSISWGSWSNVGAAKDHVASIARAFGLRHFSPDQGLAALQRILLSHPSRSPIVVNVADLKLVKQAIRQGNLLELLKTEAKPRAVASDWYEAKIREIHGANRGDRFELIRQYLEMAVRSVLKLTESELIEPDADLRELGIDSLMSMELRTKLYSLFKEGESSGSTGTSLPLQAFMDARTLNKLSELATKTLNDASGNEAAGAAEKTTKLDDDLLTLVKKDCELPAEICLPDDEAGRRVVDPSEWRHILLTGATGQLGVFLLSELVRGGRHEEVNGRRHPRVVHCLIRARSNQEARRRLETVLNDYNLLDAINLDSDSVVCIAGNMTETQFGLNDEDYSRLASSMDAVVHSAALVNHVLPYGSFGPDDIRSTNVGGLVNVLRFAVAGGKVKPLQFQSAYTVVPALAGEGTTLPVGSSRFECLLPEGYWGDASIEMGYLLSKFVGEKMLHEAAFRRGLPVTIVRHNHLTADTQSGMLGRTNHGLLLALACQRVGAVPDVDYRLTMVPIDIAAGVSVSLLLNREAWSCENRLGIYSVNNPTCVHVSQMRDFLEQRGYQTRSLPYEQWRELVLGGLAHETEGFVGFQTELAPLADFYTPNLFSSRMFAKSEFGKQLGSSRPDFRNSARLKSLVPNIDELMPHPFDLMQPYLDSYETIFGTQS